MHPSFTGLVGHPAKKLEDGSCYEGQWANGLRTGVGKSLFLNGDIYEGYWVNDQPDLVGRLITAEGDIYEVGSVQSRDSYRRGRRTERASSSKEMAISMWDTGTRTTSMEMEKKIS